MSIPHSVSPVHQRNKTRTRRRSSLEEHGIRAAIVGWLNPDLFTLSALHAFFLHTFLTISLLRAIDLGVSLAGIALAELDSQKGIG